MQLPNRKNDMLEKKRTVIKNRVLQKLSERPGKVVKNEKKVEEKPTAVKSSKLRPEDIEIWDISSDDDEESLTKSSFLERTDYVNKHSKVKN